MPLSPREVPRSPRIWFFSELFWPEETSTGYFVTRIAEDVATEFEVHAVCSQPTYAARGTVAPRSEVHNRVRIVRVRSTTLNKEVLPFRIINLLSFSAAAFVHALMHLRRGDIVVAVTNPPAVPYLVRAAAALRRTGFVLLVHDVYPEVLVATGHARADALPVRIMHAASKWLYRSADRVVVLGRDMVSIVAPKLARDAEAPVIIPNWGDTQNVRPDSAARTEMRHRLGLHDRFVIEYMGNMGRTHDLAALIDAATLLRDDDAFHFLFVGWGARRRWLEQECTGRALTNVTVHDPCAADEVSGYLNAADVAVISFRSGMAGVSVPSRLYNMLASGTPVIALADAESELAHVVVEEHSGWVVAPESPDSLVALLRELSRTPQVVAMAGSNGRRAAEERYSREASSRAWTGLLHGLRLPGSDATVAV